MSDLLSSSLPLGFGLSFLESIAESAIDVLQVSHTASTSGLSPFGFVSPVVCSLSSGWEPTSTTYFLLDVICRTSTPYTQSVCFVVSFSKRGCSLSHSGWNKTTPPLKRIPC